MLRLIIVCAVLSSMFATRVTAPRLDTGTSIICIRAPDRIAVGADSLIARHTLDGTAANDYECKIYHHGSLYFAFAGLRDVGGYYNSREIASEVAKVTDNAADARDAFVTRMIPLLERSLSPTERAFPKYYAENIDPPHQDPKFVFFEALFFGFREARSEYAYASFKVVRSASGARVVRNNNKENCPGDGCPTGSSLKIAGKDKAFLPPFDLASFSSGHPINDIQRLITLEEKVEPDYVGGNIHIIQIDAGGARWLTNYSECVGK